MTSGEAIKEAQQQAAEKLFEEMYGSYLRINLERPGDEDTVVIGYYYDGFYADSWIRLLNNGTGDSTDELTRADTAARMTELEKAWSKLEYRHFWVRFAPGTTKVLEHNNQEANIPQFPQLDVFRSELPEDLAQWVVSEFEGQRLEQLSSHVYKHVLLISDIRDSRVRAFFQKKGFFEKIEGAFLAQEKAADELFAEEMGEYKYYHLDTRRLSTDTDKLVVSYYHIFLEVEVELRFLSRSRVALVAEWSEPLE